MWVKLSAETQASPLDLVNFVMQLQTFSSAFHGPGTRVDSLSFSTTAGVFVGLWENWQDSENEVAQNRRGVCFDPKPSLAQADVAHATQPVQPQPVPTVQAAGLADHATERRLQTDLVSIQHLYNKGVCQEM